MQLSNYLFPLVIGPNLQIGEQLASYPYWNIVYRNTQFFIYCGQKSQ